MAEELKADIRDVEEAFAARCTGTPGCPLPHKQLDRLIAAARPAVSHTSTLGKGDERHMSINAHVCCVHDPKVHCCDNHPAAVSVNVEEIANEYIAVAWGPAASEDDVRRVRGILTKVLRRHLPATDKEK